MFGVAGALEDGVDVGTDLGEGSGDGRHYAGLVVDDEAEVMGSEELTGDLTFADGERDGLAALRDAEEVGDDRYSGGFTPGTVAGEDDVSAEAAADYYHILRAVGPGDGRGHGDQHGGDAGVDGGALKLRAGDLTDGAVELFGVGEVDGVDGGDGLGGDGVGIELGVHGDAGEDAELGAGVVAIDVGGGVGLSVAELLGVGEDGGVGGTGLHAGEDVVAGAVDDAA